MDEILNHETAEEIRKVAAALEHEAVDVKEKDEARYKVLVHAASSLRVGAKRIDDLYGEV